MCGWWVAAAKQQVRARRCGGHDLCAALPWWGLWGKGNGTSMGAVDEKRVLLGMGGLCTSKDMRPVCDPAALHTGNTYTTHIRTQSHANPPWPRKRRVTKPIPPVPPWGLLARAHQGLVAAHIEGDIGAASTQRKHPAHILRNLVHVLQRAM